MAIQPIDFSGSIEGWNDGTADYVSRIATAPITTIQKYDGIHQTEMSRRFGWNASAEQIAATQNPPLTAVTNATQPSITPGGDSQTSAAVPIQPIDFSGSVANWTDATADYVSRIATTPIETIQKYDRLNDRNFSDRFGASASAAQVAATKTNQASATVNTPARPLASSTTNGAAGSPTSASRTQGATMPTTAPVDFSGSILNWDDATAYYVSSNALAPVSTIRIYDLKNQKNFAKVWGQDASAAQKAAATAPSFSLASAMPWVIGVGLLMAFWPKKRRA